jgi:N-acetylglucosamine-6-sulfatase
MHRVLSATIAVVLVLAACSSPSSTSGTSTSRSTATAAATSQQHPNVLFVLTDDMRLDDLRFMPHVRALVGEQGVTFDDYFDNVTLCCPARTSILRGQYSHNTGVLTNGGTSGGFETAYAKHVEQQTIATAMQHAGYTTGLFGKYLNGYPNTAGAQYIPPGWDAWASSTSGNAYGEYDYTLNHDGKQVAYGHAPSDYGTDVYTNLAIDFMDGARAAHQPFFTYLAVYAPHQPATPAPQDTKSFPGLQAPRDASYNEADVSDKPAWVRNRPLMTPRVQTRVDRLARKRAQSLQAVDRDVAKIVTHLRQTGQLDDTVVIFTSDNGFHLGQHRLPAGKQTAYETDIHLPLMVRGPGMHAGTHVSAITGDIDLAPTIAALGGATLTDSPDGRSLVPFLSGSPPAAARWRQAYLLEHWPTTLTPQDRSGSGELEPDDLDQKPPTTTGGATSTTGTTAKLRAGKDALSGITPFKGIRTARYTYVEYSTGERELYDLRSDPDELHNLASTASRSLLDELHQRVAALQSCRSRQCWEAEDAPFAATG